MILHCNNYILLPRLEFVNARSTWQMVKSVLSFTEKNETLNKVIVASLIII